MTSTRLSRRALLPAMALVAALATSGLPTGAAAAELDIETINAMDQATFVETFGGIFEKSPWVAEAGWNARPFDSIDDLHEDLYAVIANAPREAQVEFLNQHPELAVVLARTEGDPPDRVAIVVADQPGNVPPVDQASKRPASEVR